MSPLRTTCNDVEKAVLEEAPLPAHTAPGGPRVVSGWGLCVKQCLRFAIKVSKMSEAKPLASRFTSSPDT